MMKHQIIIDENDDRLILSDSIIYKMFCIFIWIFSGVFSVIFSMYIFDGSNYVLYLPKFTFIIIAAFMFYFGLYDSLVTRLVIIDKKSQIITVRRDSILKRLTSVKEIPISDIKKIEAY